MNKSLLFIGLLLWAVAGCRPAPEASTRQASEADDKMLVLPDSSRCAGTFTLSRLADTVFYVSLHSKLANVLKVHYLDSIIFVQDMHQVHAFDASGRLLYDKDAYAGCLDVDAASGVFYTYEPLTNEVKAYDFAGKELHHFTVQAEGNSFYGSCFLAVSDSLFAKANGAQSEAEVVFFNRKGQVVERVKNPKPAIPQPGAHTYNEVWNRPLFRSPMGLRFHRCYGDTLFAVEEDGTLRPVLVERIVKKVPFDKRLDVVGGDETAYLALCDKEGYAALRMYENSRFFLAEYLIGKSAFRMPGYWLYDRADSTLHRAGISLREGLQAHTFHFGIFNDYDGGLGFAPMCQSGNYLIMVNAGSVQPADFSNHPKQLYEKGRKHLGETYACRSGMAASRQKEAAAEAFFRNFDDEKDTMLMIARMKKAPKRQ